MASVGNEATLLCQAVARRLMADNDWRLIGETVFVEAVLAHVPADQALDPQQIRRWCISAYCSQALYPACLGALGPDSQRRAFEELAGYLERIARRRWPDVAQEAVQTGLVMIYEKVRLCRTPEAFLAFAIQQVWDAAKKHMRVGQRAVSLEEWQTQLDADGEAADRDIAAAGDEGLEAVTLDADLRRQVAARIRVAWQGHPRARRQLEAVWLRYLHELSNEEVARVLETTPQNVSVLINRGLEKLREDDELERLAGEILRRSGSS